MYSIFLVSIFYYILCLTQINETERVPKVTKEYRIANGYIPAWMLLTRCLGRIATTDYLIHFGVDGKQKDTPQQVVVL